MKLARPDTFHPRIVLAGCPRHVAGDGDDAGLVTALRHRGLHCRWLSWDDPEIARADLVIMRATHDYAERLDEFLTWTTGVASLLNPAAVVAWNADRRYLADLAGRGVPTVPGEVVAPGERVGLPRRGDVFVGPTVGTGTRRFSDRSAAQAYIAELHRRPGRACWCSRRVRPQRRCWSSSAASRRTRSPSGRAPACFRLNPSSSSGMLAPPRWPPRPPTRLSCCTRGRT